MMPKERFTDHELHDLKAALSDFFMYMSSIEATIEKLFVRELDLPDRSAEIILPRLPSVWPRWEMIQQSCRARHDPKDFLALMGGLNEQYSRLRASRNSYAHNLSMNEQRNCLSFRSRRGEEEALTGPTIEYELKEARELFHDLTLLTFDLDTIRSVEEMTPGNPRISVIRAAYEAREDAAKAK